MFIYWSMDSFPYLNIKIMNFYLRFMKLRTLFIVVLMVQGTFGYGQVNAIKMHQTSGGVYKVDCKVNGVPMWFVFDSGASTSQISKTEALFLIKNDKLSSRDFIDDVELSIADGSTMVGKRCVIKSLEIGSKVYRNVEMVIVLDSYAPLLLGQNVMGLHKGVVVDYVRSEIKFYDEKFVTFNEGSLDAELIRFCESQKFAIKALNDSLIEKRKIIQKYREELGQKDNMINRLKQKRIDDIDQVNSKLISFNSIFDYSISVVKTDLVKFRKRSFTRGEGSIFSKTLYKYPSVGAPVRRPNLGEKWFISKNKLNLGDGSWQVVYIPATKEFVFVESN